jgi:hypothetical protein
MRRPRRAASTPRSLDGLAIAKAHLVRIKDLTERGRRVPSYWASASWRAWPPPSRCWRACGPAVVAVAHATRLIRDGQRIRVHGIGYIEILHKH